MTKVQNITGNHTATPAISGKVFAAGTAAANGRHIVCRLRCREIRASANLPGLCEVFARLESASILGGNPARTDTGRFSYFAAQPKEILEFGAGQNDPFGKLQKALAKYKLEKDSDIDLPRGIFRGGWIGYFSYELGRYIERLPAAAVDDIGLPLIRLCFYDRFIAYDHQEESFWLFVLGLPDDAEEPEEKLAALERLLAESEKIPVPQPVTADLENIDFSQVRSNMDKNYYLRTVDKIQRYIYDGEVYQINFSQRFECDYDARAIELADGVIQTKPIKGTRPRLDEAGEAALQARQTNTRNFNELLGSEKEQAELNMIIDLERNDVARICRPGSRSVVQPRTIETYPTVFHAVATVAGQLRKEISFCDVLKALFPGGSITGAPKIRSMEIIDETEPTARGVYTGSIGFIGIDGSASLNIAIRTIIIENKKAYAQTGGGIVADSDPEAEWAETIVKARALLAGINSVMRHA